MKAKLLISIILFLFVLVTNVKAQNQFWAVTLNGGTLNQGAIIHANSNGTGLTVVHNFDGPAGFHPYGNLLHASDGNLYGTCYDGGTFSSCTIYRFEPATGTYTDVVSFDIIHGDFPRSGVIEGPGGMLYGAASDGGANGDGVIYSYEMSTGIYTDVFDFIASGGATPYGNPVLHTNGKLYGMTVAGGLYNMGVIYSFDIVNNIYTDLYDFDGTNGNYPKGCLLQLSNGMLYGMTSTGGLNNDGVLLSFDPATNAFTKLIDFNGGNGAVPLGSLMQATNGLLYGTTSAGGVMGAGTIFGYDVITNVLTNIHSFNITDGENPLGSLTQSSNTLCGTTSNGGTTGQGVMFNYNISTSTYTKVVDFTGINGANPSGGFIQVSPTGIGENATSSNDISLFPNPVYSEFTVTLPPGTSANAAFALRDAAGKAMYAPVKNTDDINSKTINVNGIKAGTYFLEIHTGKEKILKKVVKK